MSSTEYAAVHAYLVSHFPKTCLCEECGERAKTQHALIRGRQYSRNREDYRELCPRCHARYDQGGELNSQAKLTWSQVREIRSRYRPSRGGGGPGAGRKEGSSRALAEEYGVSHGVILKIIHNEKWTAELEEE